MHRVALIYNPVAGQRPQRRAALIKGAAPVLHSSAIEVEVIPTESTESVETQAQQAIRDGCDTILACGGDGTVHQVLQSVVGTSAALGVIPMGIANALAADLGLPASPGCKRCCLPPSPCGSPWDASSIAIGRAAHALAISSLRLELARTLSSSRGRAQG